MNDEQEEEEEEYESVIFKPRAKKKDRIGKKLKRFSTPKTFF